MLFTSYWVLFYYYFVSPVDNVLICVVASHRIAGTPSCTYHIGMYCCPRVCVNALPDRWIGHRLSCNKYICRVFHLEQKTNVK